MARTSDGRPKAYGPTKHGNKWRIQFVTRPGRGAREVSYATFDTEAEATRALAGARDEAQGVTIGAAVTAFLRAKELRGRPPITIDTYRHMLDTIVGHVAGRPVRYLNGRGAELYARATIFPPGHRRAGKPRAAASHHAALERARDLGRFCVKQKWLRANPFEDVEKIGQRVHGADKVRLTVDESRRLDAWCRSRPGDRYAVLTLAYLLLGVRASELCNRDVRDLDDGGRLFVIGRTKTRAGRRQLAIPALLADMLIGLCAGRPTDAPIFLDEHGRRLSRQMARFRVMDACEAAGVTVVPPQALRRTQATLATDAGVAGLAVAQHLGHGSTAIAEQAYIAREAVADARTERALKLIQGGKAG